MVLMRQNNWLATPTQEIQKKSQVHQDLWILGHFSDVTLVCDNDQTKSGQETEKGAVGPKVAKGYLALRRSQKLGAQSAPNFQQMYIYVIACKTHDETDSVLLSLRNNALISKKSWVQSFKEVEVF